MYDMLPFPNINGRTVEEQAVQVNNYLIQFRESLEFILSNISTENLSQDLVDKLNSLGSGIVKNQEERAEEIKQVTGKMITVYDVINSPAYHSSLDAMQTEIKEELIDELPTAPEILESLELRINFETGHLEY